MNRMFRLIIIATVFLAAGLTLAAGAYATAEPPKPAKMRKLKFPAYKEFTTDNGIDVLVVEQHEQPVVSIYAVVKTGGSADPKGKESLAGFTIDQLNKGTKTRTALELADWIESVGGSVQSNSEEDYSSLEVSILSDYLDVAYQYLNDVFLNPVFPQDELDLLKKQAKTGLEFELSDPNAMARRHLRSLVYGDHPYAKQPTVEAIEAITRDDVAAFYKRNFVANNVLLAVVGDVKSGNVKKAVKKYFGEMPQGTPDHVEYAGAPEAKETKIYLYNKPGAVQTELFVGHLGPAATNPDMPAIIVGNRILGGGADARLFMNLREDKGWTYGAYSSFSRDRDLGMFVARAPVRTEVTDSALVEMTRELHRIRDEQVSEEDLKNAKDYLVGNFPIQIETPDQIAGSVVRTKLLGLNKDYLEKYRDRIAAVTVDDVHRVMDKYLHPDNAYMVLVGDAKEIKDKVEAIAPVELYTIAGEPLSMDAMAVSAVDYDYDTSVLNDMNATYGLTVREMPIGDLIVKMTKQGGGDDGARIEVSQSVSGMIVMKQNMAFRASDLAPISYKSSMQFGPQTMSSDLAFTADGVTGQVQGPDSPEPKEVAFDMVQGAILDGALEYALGCLPLEIGTSYRFPVVDGQSGSLQTINAKIEELVDVQTAAGQFAAYKVKVQRPEGDAYMYIAKDRPHVLVKQEVPSQALSLELKSMAE